MLNNPYEGLSFFAFLKQLCIRLGDFFSGQLSFSALATDEIQILVLVGVALSSALAGSFLVLRKMTMLANSLSHTILLGIVIAFLFTGGHGDGEFLSIPAMMGAALIMGLLTTFLTEFLSKVARLQEDASTGIVFTSLFALGIILITLLTRNAHIGTEAVMGNVDALHLEDCLLIFSILGCNLFVFICFFKEFAITTFDSALSRSLGISTLFFNYLLMVQVSATAIGAFRAVGVLMLLAFITGPVLTARLLTHSLKKMILLAGVVGSSAAVFGVALARHLLSVHDLALSTAGIVVCVIAAMFATTIIGTRARQRYMTWKNSMYIS